jgi:hypothetical protein
MHVAEVIKTGVMSIPEIDNKSSTKPVDSFVDEPSIK